MISLIVFLASLLLEGMLPPANRELFDFLLLKYTLCSVVTDVTQHRQRLLGEFKKENKPNSGERNLPKLIHLQKEMPSLKRQMARS